MLPNWGHGNSLFRSRDWLLANQGVGTNINQSLLIRQLPIRTRYLGHVTGYQPIRDQYFLIRSVPAKVSHCLCITCDFGLNYSNQKQCCRELSGEHFGCKIDILSLANLMINLMEPGHDPKSQVMQRQWDTLYLDQRTAGHQNEQEPTDTSKQPILTPYLGQVTGYQPIRDQYSFEMSIGLAVTKPSNPRALTEKVSWEWCLDYKTGTSKQPIRIRYLCHVTGYQPIRDQYFLTY
eukprot:sb/3469271/